MARLGRRINHYEQVRIDSIFADFSADRRHRYTLTMEFKPDLLSEERTETTTVILKNPSSADERKSDATIRKVETFVYQRLPKTKYLNIYNIFAFRATDAIELHQLMKENDMNEGVGADNDHHLLELLKLTDQLIIAWGGPSGIDRLIYDQRVADIKKLLAKNYGGPIFEVVGSNPTNQPLHGLMWGYNYELKQVTL